MSEDGPKGKYLGVLNFRQCHKLDFCSSIFSFFFFGIQIEVFPGVVVAGAALPSTTFIAQNWTALPTMWRKAVLSPQLWCKAVPCTVRHNSTATLLLVPARTERSHHSCIASCSRKTAMQNGKKSVHVEVNFEASPPEPWKGLGTATGEVGSVPFPPTKRSNVSKLFQTAAMGQLFQAAAGCPILILMCNASFTWLSWEFLQFKIYMLPAKI